MVGSVCVVAKWIYMRLPFFYLKEKKKLTSIKMSHKKKTNWHKNITHH